MGSSSEPFATFARTSKSPPPTRAVAVVRLSRSRHSGRVQRQRIANIAVVTSVTMIE